MVLTVEKPGLVVTEGVALARRAGHVDRLLVAARGTVESKITALSRLSRCKLCEW